MLQFVLLRKEKQQLRRVNLQSNPISLQRQTRHGQQSHQIVQLGKVSALWLQRPEHVYRGESLTPLLAPGSLTSAVCVCVCVCVCVRACVRVQGSALPLKPVARMRRWPDMPS